MSFFFFYSFWLVRSVALEIALQSSRSLLPFPAPGQAGPTTSSSGAAVGSERQAAPAVSAEPREIDLRVQRAIDGVLEYHRTQRPKSTTEKLHSKAERMDGKLSVPLPKKKKKKKKNFTDYLPCYRKGVRSRTSGLVGTISHETG